MRDLLTNTDTVTFTITGTPARPAQRKTIQRLMQMQPHAAKALKGLQRQRRQKDNRTYIRAGNFWTDRARATRVTRVEPGQTFTIRVTPQIVADILSVQMFLDGKAA